MDIFEILLASNAWEFVFQCCLSLIVYSIIKIYNVSRAYMCFQTFVSLLISINI